jgi:glycogen(starch) synthase
VRVLYWSELFWPYIGGAEVFSANLIPALQQRGHEFTVVTSHDYLELPDEGCYRGTVIHRFAFRKALATGDLDLLAKTRRQVAELKETMKPDLIHIDGVSPSALFHLDTVAAHPAPLLVSMNGQILSDQGAGHNTLMRRVLLAADWVNCVSAIVLKQVREWVPEVRGHSSVIRNGLETPLPPKLSQRDLPCLVCLGRLVPAKGFDLALEALSLLLGRFPHVRLIIVGDGSERPALERKAARLGIEEAVEFVGWVEPDKVPAFLATATAVLMPSRNEGLPLVGIQAAMMGLPIVAARAGGLSEIVLDGETGLLVDVGDVDGLAEAIAYLLDRPEVAIEFGHAARQRAEELFGWQRCVAAYNALYRALSRR